MPKLLLCPRLICFLFLFHFCFSFLISSFLLLVVPERHSGPENANTPGPENAHFVQAFGGPVHLTDFNLMWMQYIQGTPSVQTRTFAAQLHHGLQSMGELDTCHAIPNVWCVGIHKGIFVYLPKGDLIINTTCTLSYSQPVPLKPKKRRLHITSILTIYLCCV